MAEGGSGRTGGTGASSCASTGAARAIKSDGKSDGKPAVKSILDFIIVSPVPRWSPPSWMVERLLGGGGCQPSLFALAACVKGLKGSRGSQILGRGFGFKGLHPCLIAEIC